MKRQDEFSALASEPIWDVVIIGGGALGLGCAVDAASRGYRVALLERFDFGKGTSTRSSKLIHGGVRYLAQGRFRFVRQALCEREILHRNAPHLVRPIKFVVPAYSWFDLAKYAAGLHLYQRLGPNLGPSAVAVLSKTETRERFPNLRSSRLCGGVQYADAQFDDARYLISLVRTAQAFGALVMNYVAVTGFLWDGAGRISGVRVEDSESRTSLELRARGVVNAAGPFVDSVRELLRQGLPPTVTLSRGSHLVLSRAKLPWDDALVVPGAGPGRVLFGIPWLGGMMVGPTHLPAARAEVEPVVSEDEIQSLFHVLNSYLEEPVTRSEIRAVFSGLRALVHSDQTGPSEISREHRIVADAPGFLSIVGGKWTSYRNIAEDCVNRCADEFGLNAAPSSTATIPLHGYSDTTDPEEWDAYYGADAPSVRALAQSVPRLADQLDPALPYRAADVVWAARYEHARTVEDILARRTRALHRDTAAAIRCAPIVARIMAEELGYGEAWCRNQVQQFLDTASPTRPSAGDTCDR